MCDGSSNSSKSSSTSGPPAYLQPYLQGAAAQAQNLYNQPGPNYFPNSTVANQSPTTQAAISGTVNRATNGSPLNQASSGYLQDTLNGKYLNAGNPNDGALWNSVQANVLPAVDAQFSLLGRYGSGQQANAAATGLTNAYAPYAFSNYQSERANQQQAAQLAPTQANQDYVDLGQLAQAGQTQDTYAQQQLNDQINRWDYNQNLPENKLNTFLGQLTGNNYGQISTTKQAVPQPSTGSDITSLAGGLLGSYLGGGGTFGL